MAIDALDRQESCGGHLREESESEEGEAIRDDENFCHVSAWAYKGDDAAPELHKEPLVFENVEYGNAIYVMFDNWEELSQKSRVDLLSGKFGENFERVVHTGDWQEKVTKIVEVKQEAN